MVKIGVSTVRDIYHVI